MCPNRVSETPFLDSTETNLSLASNPHGISALTSIDHPVNTIGKSEVIWELKDSGPSKVPRQPYPTLRITIQTRPYIRKVKILICVLVLGRFPAKLSPKTPLNGPGSNNDVERTQNQPRRPILMPFRNECLVDHQN